MGRASRSDLSSVVASLLGRESVRAVAEVLSERGIPVMPLKGVLLQATVYEDPRQRPISDVDLLVPRLELADAAGVLEERGYRRRSEGQGAVAVNLTPPNHPLLVDLHGELFPPGMFELSTEDVFRRAEADATLFGVRVFLADPLDLYAHLVGHFAKGRLGSSDRMHLRDLGMVARHHRLTPSAVASHLVATGLARAARYVLPLAAEQEGADPFASAVLRELPRDPLGAAIAAVARREMTGRGKVRALLPHALNHSLLAGARSLALHGADVLHRRRLSSRRGADVETSSRPFRD